MGTRVRPGGAAQEPSVDSRRRRCDGARGNVHGRAESRAGPGGCRARARRTDDRRRRHVVRRSPARRRRVGHRRRVQLHAEVPRRSVGPGARRLHAARAREARPLPQLLLRSDAARGLLAATEISPHDVVHARVRAVRSACDRGRRDARGAVDPPRDEITKRCSKRSGRSASACCRASANGCGR